MNILFCKWKSICEPGMSKAFLRLGHNVIDYTKEFDSYDFDADYATELAEYLFQHKDIDFVYSVNFVPIIARACKITKKKYISWTVDCILLQHYSKTVSYDTNYIFTFDRLQTEEISQFNPGHVFHLPLAADSSYIPEVTAEEIKKYSCDVSFIGVLYSKKNENYYDKIKSCLPDYMNGYIMGLLAAQSNVYGYNFIFDSLSDQWVNDFLKYTEIAFPPEYYDAAKRFIADFYINYKLSELDRVNILKAVSDRFNTHLYTTDDTKRIPNIHNMGIADSITMTPKIFQCSKINLNLTLRSIQSGIPQRVFDIMVQGGFVISNYQPEIADLFEPDKDIVMFESEIDLLNKIEYYLSHEEERIAIAKNGQKKVMELYNYETTLQNIIDQCQAL